MIRIGTYDAYDKWQILCQRWAHPNSVTEAIADKWNAPALPSWEDLALAGGTYACVDYLNAKCDVLRQEVGDAGAAAQTEATVNRDIAELLIRIGDNGLLALARTVAPAIAAGGFSARLDDRLPPRLGERLREVFKAGAIGLLRWTDMRGEVPSVEIIRTRSNRYPLQAIRHKRNVLGLFCALNYGRSDVIHIHDICPDHVSLVDNNADCLNDMRLIYPHDWEYLCTDYREYLKESSKRGRSFDLITADPPLSLATEVGLEYLTTIMKLSSDMFITNFTRQMCERLGAEPDDLEGLSRAVKVQLGLDVTFAEMMERNSSVWWAVIRKLPTSGRVMLGEDPLAAKSVVGRTTPRASRPCPSPPLRAPCLFGQSRAAAECA